MNTHTHIYIYIYVYIQPYYYYAFDSSWLGTSASRHGLDGSIGPKVGLTTFGVEGSEMWTSGAQGHYG